MKPRAQAVKVLEESGYTLKRRGRNHDIYYNPTLRASIPLKRHDFDESDLRYIKKELNLIQRGQG